MSFAQFVLANEATIRLGFFLGMFALIGTREALAPRPEHLQNLASGQHLGIVALNTLVINRRRLQDEPG